ncbi:MAG: DNA polymerase III subunit delta [Candidatus Gastranaerophilales bacterium]|nr:DNA polymerase III subunit delta [Candidatus Gastranaerophilales bacterium]
MPAYLYWGEEDFTLEKAVKHLKDQILDPEWVLLNHKILDEPDIKELIESLQSIPMVFGNLLIEIRTSSLFSRGGKKSFATDSQYDKLMSLVETLNSNIHVLFISRIQRESGKKVDSSLKITKLIQKIGEIKAFEAFKSYQEKDLIEWISKCAESKGIKINKEPALVLLQNTGPELRKLDTELEKLKLNAAPKTTITKEAVISLCSTYENIFVLAEYWLQNKKSRAVIELHKLYEKDHPLKIIATLQTLLRRWMKIKIESQTKNSYEISRIVNLHKFVVEKDMEKLQSTSIEMLVEFKKKLSNAEFSIKAGKLEAEMALDLVISS